MKAPLKSVFPMLKKLGATFLCHVRCVVRFSFLLGVARSLYERVQGRPREPRPFIYTFATLIFTSLSCYFLSSELQSGKPLLSAFLYRMRGWRVASKEPAPAGSGEKLRYLFPLSGYVAEGRSLGRRNNKSLRFGVFGKKARLFAPAPLSRLDSGTQSLGCFLFVPPRASAIRGNEGSFSRKRKATAALKIDKVGLGGNRISVPHLSLYLSLSHSVSPRFAFLAYGVRKRLVPMCLT